MHVCMYVLDMIYLRIHVPRMMQHFTHTRSVLILYDNILIEIHP